MPETNLKLTASWYIQSGEVWTKKYLATANKKFGSLRRIEHRY